MPHRHRPTGLKQVNKSHKGSNSSKRAVSRNAHGRVERVDVKSASMCVCGLGRAGRGETLTLALARRRSADSRQARVNRSIQVRRVKQDALRAERRLGACARREPLATAGL